MPRLLLVFALLIAGMSPAQAQERSSLLPDIPKATGEPHPEGNEYWRRNHMHLMQHDRNLTTRDGDREIGASLKSCFDCHAAKDAAGTIVTYESDQHFCRSCHDYVAVKVDCFMCHRSTPDGVDEGAAHAATLPQSRSQDEDGTSIIAYLRQVGQDGITQGEPGK
ncbi:MAG: putative CXXCH cytochrome family protein [Paracoccaceae bacterium]|jgi:predicted CXXCH cytochrome family protein